MSMMQEKMYMDVDDVCAILGVSKTYAYSLMREYNKELKARGLFDTVLNCTRRRRTGNRHLGATAFRLSKTVP